MNSMKKGLAALLIFLPLTVMAGPFDDEAVSSPRVDPSPAATIPGISPGALIPEEYQRLGSLSITLKQGDKPQTFSGLQAFALMKDKKENMAKSLETFLNRFRHAPWFEKLTGKKGGSSIVFGEKSATMALGSDGFIVFTRDGLDRAAVYRYSRLNDDERRILEASSMEVNTPEGKKTLSGYDLFGYLAVNQPESLQGFFNVCAKLRSSTYTFLADGNPVTALSYVTSVHYFARDRFRAESDPALKTLMAKSKRFSKVKGHGEHFPDSFKQNDVTSAGGQLCFSPDGTSIEADVDMYNIARGGKNPLARLKGFMGHTGEVLMPGKTDPYKIRNMLVKQKAGPSGDLLELPDDSATLEKLVLED